MSKATSSPVSLKNNVLIEPKRKKIFCFPKRYPLPIFRDSGEETTSWNCVIGHLKDHCVEVSEEKDIELLFMQGFYGKGTLSRSTPYALEKKFLPDKRNSSKSKNQTQKSQSEVLSLSVDNKDKGDESVKNPAKRPKNDEIEDVLSNKPGTSAAAAESLTKGDSDSVLDVVTVSPSKNIPKESLQLSLEEAYFLSYAFGVLVVKDREQPLDLMRLWIRFCDIHPNKNFPVMYTAYHHFRSKGWIVKSGLKYGCDYVLYKDGPPFYHGSYAVIVKAVKEKNFRDVSDGGRPNLTWAALSAVHRICSHAAKAVMFLYVIKPSAISENKISTPFCISQYQLEEVLVNRWVPSEEQRPGCSSLKEK